MLYLATASGPKVCDAMTAGQLGQMVTPDTGNRIQPGVPWALDNGCFNARWNVDTWQAALDKHKDTPGCLFAVVPDVVADAEATDVMWRRWASAVSRRGYRCAYVAQNGCQRIPAGAEAVFIGGDTAWKLGPEARQIAKAAKASGRWLHMGRVNTLRRLRYAAAIGCDSVDGTFLAFGPDVNLPRLTRYLRRAAEPTLWNVEHPAVVGTCPGGLEAHLPPSGQVPTATGTDPDVATSAPGGLTPQLPAGAGVGAAGFESTASAGLGSPAGPTPDT